MASIYVLAALEWLGTASKSNSGRLGRSSRLLARSPEEEVMATADARISSHRCKTAACDRTCYVGSFARDLKVSLGMFRYCSWYGSNHGTNLDIPP